MPRSQSSVQSMKAGFAIGLGMSFARDLVDQIIRPTVYQEPKVAPMDLKEFKKCMYQIADYDTCKSYLE